MRLSDSLHNSNKMESRPEVKNYVLDDQLFCIIFIILVVVDNGCLDIRDGLRVSLKNYNDLASLNKTRFFSLF